MSGRFVINDPASSSQFRDRAGAVFACRCGGTQFSLREIHNPYGDDMCPQVLRCHQCGTEWEGGYSGSPRFERTPDSPLPGGTS